MATIFSTNSLELTPAWKPIIFQINNSVANALQVSADIYLNGTLFSTVYSDKKVVNYGGGLYSFMIDVSAPIKDFLSHKLLDYGTAGDTVDDQAQARVNITFFEWRISSGFLTKDAVTSIASNTFVALNATRNFNELLTLERNLYSSGTGENRALSNRPIIPFSLFMQVGESEQLGIYADTASHYTVLCTDQSGAVFRGGIRTLSSFTTHGGIRTNATRQLGVGAENINNTTWTPWYGGLPAPLIDNQVRSYLIAWGVPVTIFGLQLFNVYAGMRYFVGHQCDGFRVHFLNRYGVFDSYTFPKFTKGGLETTPSNFEKPLVYGSQASSPVAPASKERGLSILNVRSEQTFEIESYALTEEESAWLVELASSPEVFGEILDYTGAIINVPLVMDKGKYDTLEDQDTGYASLKFSGSFGRLIESQST